MEQSSSDFRRKLYENLVEDIAEQEAIIAMMRDGRLRTHSKTAGQPMKDTTEGDLRHCEQIVAMLNDVIDKFYPAFKTPV